MIAMQKKNDVMELFMFGAVLNLQNSANVLIVIHDQLILTLYMKRS